MFSRFAVICFTLNFLMNCAGNNFSLYPEDNTYGVSCVTTGDWNVTINSSHAAKTSLISCNSHSISLGILDERYLAENEIRLAIMDA